MESKLIPELTNQGWYQLIEVAKNASITPETISETYQSFLKLRAVYEWLNEREEEDNKEEKEIIATRKAAYDKLRKPIKEILNNADALFAAVNKDILCREKAIGEEIEKENKLRTDFMDFVNVTTKNIVVATDTKELGKIQMLIGSKKSTSKSYGDDKSKIDSICDRLLSLIDDRKVFLKEDLKLESDYKKANDSGDIVLATQIRSEIDDHKRVLEENANQLAQDAYREISSLAVMNNDMVSAAITPRLHRWSWRVDNIEKLYKKMPQMVDKIPNTKAINTFMSELKEEKGLNPYEENEFHGLVIWNKEFYVSVSK